ncbi:aspartate aminotransferase family protein [Mesorhizobium sp. CO1-1-8]|uniref:aspartate aminotransferase family protein n=1 Tax=Mesorhizobium sp. CO1-1-8 TaxID=2876631 RepID=UPI001CD052C7|nr:aminotransferase class III-fold pyridoxal phosphate-dependent enzyme [Mesorhizobium sp. CO1-1-8]MBZ9772192.1 aminotransferase class III-fold pyridoxal phosphate-dependent enzyme [Mesorhizobium sp. CO1-1-8]
MGSPLPVEAQYEQKTKASASFESSGREALPIVSSRGIAFHPPYPLLVERAQGAFLWDADGNEYVDLSSNMYVFVHGNAYAPITEAVIRQLHQGSAWSANNRSLVTLADLLRQRMPSLEKIAFQNSGTEAFSLAWNIARAATGKSKFMMAAGGYHGTLYEASLGSKGIAGPSHLVGVYNDAESFERTIAENADALCAVFIEPVLGAGGLAAASDDFLRRVRDACTRHGVVLVFDEVVSFRLSEGGAQASMRVKPDLTMLGKVIGGGFPIGAVGGDSRLLSLADPVNPKVFISGTFTGNPIATTAGYVAVNHLTQSAIDHIGSVAEEIETRFGESAKRLGIRLWIRRVGSLLSWFFHNPGDGAVLGGQRPDVDILHLYHLALLNRGLFAIPRGAMTVSTAMTPEIVARICEQMELSLKDILPRYEETN